MWRLFWLWRRFVALLRSIILSVKSGKPINWSEKAEEATDLANDYLDQSGCPKLPSTSTESPSNTESVKREPRLRRRRRNTRKTV